MKPKSSLFWLFSSTLACLIVSACAFPDEPDTLRLDRKVIPVFQSIRLKLDPGKKDYQGETDFLLDVRSATRNFRLHSKDLKIKELKLQSGGHRIPVEWNAKSDDLLRISAKQPLEPGGYDLQIRFVNNYQDKGMGLFKGLEGGKPYLATQFETSYAREAFPCWDEPGFKNPFQVTLTIPEVLQAFSNTAVEDIRSSGKEKTILFQKTPPLPVYLVAFAVGPFESVPITEMPVPGSVVVPMGETALAAEAVNLTPPILKDLEKRFGPYPFQKLDLMAMPGMMMGAMENPGLIIFSSWGLLFDPKSITVDQRLVCARVISHEIAHMWFGDMVTMAWWNDAWLNESFATWIQTNVLDDVFPHLNSFLWDIQSFQYSMGTDALPSTGPIRRTIRSTDDPLQVFDELSYRKGGTVLGMVESWAGKENFGKGIIEYLEKHRWGNAESEDFWISLSRGIGENAADLIGSFVNQPGLPLVRAELLSPAKLKLSQSRFLNCGFQAAPQRWRIPMVVDYAAGAEKFRKKLVLAEDSEVVALDCTSRPDWVNLNADARGYYRWLVPDDVFLALADRSTEILNVRERIAFLGNASALLDGGVLRGDAFLKMLRSFASDDAPEVLQAVLDGFRKMNNGLVGIEAKASYARFVRSVLNPVLSRIGSEKRPNEGLTVAMLRSGLISVLADIGGDVQCIRRCDSLTAVYFQSPESVDAALVDPILNISALYGDQDLFERYRHEFEAARTPADKSRYLWNLGAFRNRGLLVKALEYAMSGPLDPMECLFIPFTAARSPENRGYLLDWAIQNYDALKSKASLELMDFLVPDLVTVCSDTLLRKAKNFFLDPSRARQTLDINLDKAADRITTVMRVREKEGPAVAEYLKRY